MNVPSPITVGFQRTAVRGEVANFTDTFAQHRAIALSGLIDAPFFARLAQICRRAHFVTDTATDVAHRQRETPGVAGSALMHALNRSELLRWLEAATGSGTLRSVSGRIVQNVVGDVHRLNWHDDLPENPTRRIGITINLSENPYEGGLFELRKKKTQQILTRHRHEKPGSALIFDVSDALEHRVWPVTSGGPRRIFAGWFLVGDPS